jgi:Mn-dependent DtxR family transcriptional regulator
VVSLTASQENYLKTIYLEVSKNGYAKMSDIATLLSVKKSSVSAALNILVEKGLINYVPYSQITLTAIGLTNAREIIEKFDVMSIFFCKILKLEMGEAITNSCRLEHVMSEELFRRLSKFCKFTEKLYENDVAYRKQLDDLLSQAA